MLRKRLLATLLATALLLSATLPALAAPAHEETEPPSIMSMVISWFSKSFGLETGSVPEAKLGSFVDPTGSEGSSNPNDDGSTMTISTTSSEDELGSAVIPDG